MFVIACLMKRTVTLLNHTSRYPAMSLSSLVYLHGEVYVVIDPSLVL